MHIRKLYIKGFGKLIEKEYSLGEGFNIFFGDNESGKTTIQWFIRGILYGLKGGRTLKDGSLPPAKHFKPWSGDPFKGFMEYKLDNGNEYRIVRDFLEQSVKVQDLKTFEDITQNFKADRNRGILVAEEHLGINESCFAQSVYIGQMESRLDAPGKNDLAEKLTNMSSTGNEDLSYQKAEAALKNALLEMVGTDKSIKRPKDILERKIKELDEKREILDRKHEVVLESEAKLEVCRREAEALERRMEVLLRGAGMIRLRKDIAGKKKLLGRVKSISDELKDITASIGKMRKQLDELTKQEKALAGYKEFSKEDRDWASVTWHSILKMEQEIEYSLLQLDGIKEEKQVQVQEFDGLEFFEKMGRDEYLNLTNLFIIDVSNDSNKKKDINENNKRLEELRRKKKSSIFFGSVSVSLMILALVLGYFTPLGWLLYVSPIFLITAGFGALLARRNNIESAQVRKDREFKDVISRRAAEENREKEKARAVVMGQAGVDNAADFLRLKDLYEDKKRHLEELDKKLLEWNQVYEDKRETVGQQKHELSEILKRVDIPAEAEQINQSHIDLFKRNYDSWADLKPGLLYTRERYNEACTVMVKQMNQAKDLLEATELDEDLLAKTIESIGREIDSKETEMEHIKNILDSEPEEVNIILKRVLTGDIVSIDAEMECELESTRREIEQNKLKIREYETQLGDLPMEEELQNIVEQIDMLKQEKIELEEFGDCIEVAIAALQESSRELQLNFVPELNREMGNILARLTSGKYTEIKSDERLMLNTSIPGTEEIVAIPALSGGTIDQAYLSLRIGAANIILGKGEKIPFIFDEIFAQYDDIRAQSTLDYLKDTCRTNQCLFFTCKKREIELVQEVFEGTGYNIIQL